MCLFASYSQHSRSNGTQMQQFLGGSHWKDIKTKAGLTPLYPTAYFFNQHDMKWQKPSNVSQDSSAGTYFECCQVERFSFSHLTTAFQELNKSAYSDTPVDIEENITHFNTVYIFTCKNFQTELQGTSMKPWMWVSTTGRRKNYFYTPCVNNINTK